MGLAERYTNRDSMIGSSKEHGLSSPPNEMSGQECPRPHEFLDPFPLSSSTSIGCPIGNRGRCIILSLGGWQTPYLVKSLSAGMRSGRFGIGCIHGRGMRIRNSNTTRNFQLPWTIGSMPATGVACYAIRIWRPLCLTCYCILTVSVTRWKRLSSCQTTSTCYSVFLHRIIWSPWCSPGKASRRVKSIGNWEKTGGCGSRITGTG